MLTIINVYQHSSHHTIAFKTRWIIADREVGSWVLERLQEAPSSAAKAQFISTSTQYRIIFAQNTFSKSFYTAIHSIHEEDTMSVKEVLLLGNPALYNPSVEIKKGELKTVTPLVKDLHDTLMDFRQKYGAGRAIAAPQIGVAKRLIYQYITEPVVYINPVLTIVGNDTVDLWDDCMSFPDILVKVTRHRGCRIQYYDLQWEFHTKTYEDDLSELLQHEYDHLNGILAVSRAIDGKSFCLRSQSHFIH